MLRFLLRSMFSVISLFLAGVSGTYGMKVNLNYKVHNQLCDALLGASLQGVSRFETAIDEYTVYGIRIGAVRNIAENAYVGGDLLSNVGPGSQIEIESGSNMKNAIVNVIADNAFIPFNICDANNREYLLKVLPQYSQCTGNEYHISYDRLQELMLEDYIVDISLRELESGNCIDIEGKRFCID